MTAEQDSELVITAGQIIDGTGREPIQHGAILVESGTISAVGGQEEFGSRLERSARLDFPNATLLPGLIDCHSHLVLWGDMSIPFASIQDEPDERLLLRAAANARVTLAHGVTTLADLGGRGTLTFALRDGIARGYVSGPRLVLSGRPITTTGGHCWYFGGEADGPDRLRHLVRELVKQGADIIKIMTTGGGTVGTDPYRAYFTPEELRTVVEEGRRAGKVTAAHCTGFAGLTAAVDAGFDLLVHATFFGADGSYQFDEATAERIVAAGSFVNPTMHVTRTRIEGYKQLHPRMNAREASELASIEASYAAKIDAVGRLHKMGARIVAGSDAGWAGYRFGDFYLELDALTDAGLTPMEAIVAGTSRAAECLQVDDLVGTITPRKAADLLVVAGDPLIDMHALARIEAVFLNGQRQTAAAQVTPATIQA